ncbi:MAG: hypothetical protein ACI857_001240 [Arenicella sp.]|jgi:hypothetical protein
MKKIFFILLLVIFQAPSVIGQCCPYLTEVVVYPQSPTTIDSIYLVTKVTTPNLGNYLGYTVSESGNSITVEGCYYSGLLTQWQTYVDSINLGTMIAGNYNLNFIAYQSNNSSSCTHSDTNSVQLNFVVDPYLSVDNYDSSKETKCYPNPVSSGFFIVSSAEKIKTIEVINSLGVLVLRHDFVNSTQLNLDITEFSNSILFVKIINEDQTFSIEKVLIE